MVVTGCNVSIQYKCTQKLITKLCINRDMVNMNVCTCIKNWMEELILRIYIQFNFMCICVVMNVIYAVCKFVTFCSLINNYIIECVGFHANYSSRLQLCADG